MGFALWLVPTKDELAALERLKGFRPRHYRKSSSSRSYPHFAPHITLATFTTPGFSSLPAILPDGLREVSVLFESTKAGNTFLGAYGVNIAKTQDLLAMGKDIVQHMRGIGIEPKQGGFPHMSLFYVDEPEERRDLEQELKSTKRVTTVRDGSGSTVWLDPRSRRFEAMCGFTGAEIWLVDCNSKDPNAWHVMDKIRLKKKRSRHTYHQPSTKDPVPHTVTVNDYHRPTEPQNGHPQQVEYYRSHHRPAIQQYYEVQPEGRRSTRRDDGRGRSSSGRQPGEGNQRDKRRRRATSASRYDEDNGCFAWLNRLLGLSTGGRR